MLVVGCDKREGGLGLCLVLICWAYEGLLHRLACLADGVVVLVLFGDRGSTGGVQSAHMPLYATVA